MFSQLEEHNDFHYSTDTEWDNAEAAELGAQNPSRAWICTNRDVWHKNPYYTGPRVPHPESYEAECNAYNEEKGAPEQDDDCPF